MKKKDIAAGGKHVPRRRPMLGVLRCLVKQDEKDTKECWEVYKRGRGFEMHG